MHKTERVQRFEACIEGEVDGTIDMDRVAEFSNVGIPDAAHLRPLYWKVLLGYLPTDRSKWDETLTDMRKLYNNYIKAFLIDCRKEMTVSDPLGCSMNDPLAALEPKTPATENTEGTPETPWDEYQLNVELMSDIDKDVRRTHPDIHFFQSDPAYLRKYGVITGDIASYQADAEGQSPQRVQFTNLTPKTPNERGNVFEGSRPRTRLRALPKSLSDHDRLANGTFGGLLDKPQVSSHHAALVRILLVFARTNVAIKYVQGLNELASVIYYVFYTDAAPEERQHAEADAFWCFFNLMSPVMDLYTKDLDGDKSGLRGNMDSMMETLAAKDPTVHAHLERLGIPPDFFAIRWFTLLMGGEFALPDVVRVWDSLLSTFGGACGGDLLAHLRRVAVSMIVSIRDILLSLDYSGTIQTLQKFPASVDLNMILRGAMPDEVEE